MARRVVSNKINTGSNDGVSEAPPSLPRRPLQVSDEGLGLGAVVYLGVDLGVLVALVPQALQVAAVAHEVEREAESQHAQHQQAHVDLRKQRRGGGGSERRRDSFNMKTNMVIRGGSSPRGGPPPGVPPWP